MDYEVASAVEKKSDTSGILEILDGTNLPFTPKRIYWIRDVPQGATRGHHAHMNLRQAALMIAGSMTFELTDHLESTEVELLNDGKILLIEPGYWRVMKNFSEDAILLVLADAIYDESDYIREWSQYIDWKKHG